MFENVEKKLKTYATANFVCVIVFAIFLFLAGVSSDDLGYALRHMNGLGFLLVFLLLSSYALIVYALLASCWFIQAFAEITESVKKITDSTKQTNEILQTAFAENISEEKKKTHKLLLAEAEAARIAAEKKAEAERVLAAKQRAIFEEKQQRYKAYWAEHADERAALLAKRREAEDALKSVGSLAGKEREQLQKLIGSIDEELNKER